MADYSRTVDAALSETQSKFRLAEALALDIPPRHPGPSGDEPVDAYIAQAQAAIVAAGGEYRTVETLKQYRKTALWVGVDLYPNFQWAKGRSYSAHDEARRAGMTYEQFVAMPKATVDTIRQQAGRAGTDGQPAAIARSWPQHERVQLARETLRDPAARREVLGDPGLRSAVQRDIEAAAQPGLRADAEAREWERGIRDSHHELRCLEGITAVERATRLIVEQVPAAGRVQWRDDERQLYLEAIESLEQATSLLARAITGTQDTDWDAEVAKVTGGR